MVSCALSISGENPEIFDISGLVGYIEPSQSTLTIYSASKKLGRKKYDATRYDLLATGYH
jgi:hypothetical protein